MEQRVESARVFREGRWLCNAEVVFQAEVRPIPMRIPGRITIDYKPELITGPTMIRFEDPESEFAGDLERVAEAARDPEKQRELRGSPIEPIALVFENRQVPRCWVDAPINSYGSISDICFELRGADPE